jgi:hypothetical protein
MCGFDSYSKLCWLGQPPKSKRPPESKESKEFKEKKRLLFKLYLLAAKKNAAFKKSTQKSNSLYYTFLQRNFWFSLEKKLSLIQNNNFLYLI